MKFLYLLALVVMLSVSVSAWPYELYSNGTIVDLNSSNNQTTNLTIYYYNVTYVTENITEHNNITNVNQTTNLSNYYTKAESEGRYLRLGSQYGNTEVFSRAELQTIITNLNNTDANLTAQLDEITDTPTGWLWAGILLAIVLAGAALVLIGKENNY